MLSRCWEIIPHIVSTANILFMAHFCCVQPYHLSACVCVCMSALSFAVLYINIYIYFCLSVSSVCLFLHAVCVHISESQCVCVCVSGHLFSIGSGPYSQGFVFLLGFWDQEDRYVPDLLLRCTVPYPHCLLTGPICQWCHLEKGDCF